MTIQSLIDNIIEKNAIGVQETFNSLLAERIATKLEEHKKTVAQTMFTGFVNEDTSDVDQKLAYHKEKVDFHTAKQHHYVALADEEGNGAHFSSKMFGKSILHADMARQHQNQIDVIKSIQDH